MVAVRTVYLSLHVRKLQAWYDEPAKVDDVNEAVVLSRDVLTLCTPGHPLRPISLDYLAVHLSSRYNLLGAIDELNEAIVLGRKALSLRPPGHPDHSVSLESFNQSLLPVHAAGGN